MAKRYPARCSVAERDRIVLANRGLIGRVVGNMSRSDVAALDSAEDACQTGYFGLSRAAELYDPEKAAFSTYAYSAIYHYLRSHITGGLVRVPRHERERRQRVGEPMPIVCCFPRFRDLDGELHELEPTASPEPDPYEHEELANALAKLTPGERSLIQARFMEEVPVRALGIRLHISANCVVKRTKKVLAKLRQLMETEGPEGGHGPQSEGGRGHVRAPVSSRGRPPTAA